MSQRAIAIESLSSLQYSTILIESPMLQYEVSQQELKICSQVLKKASFIELCDPTAITFDL